MKKEVKSAVDFLAKILRTSKYVNEQQVSIFNESLQNLLCAKYENHWFPSKPNKGSGFRCIRINHSKDPLILQAGLSCGLSDNVLFSIIPKELTIWVDPFDVSYRIGENGSIGVLFESNNTSQTQSSHSSSSVSSDMMSFSANSCKGQFLNEFPRDMGFKQLAAYVYS
ncbi:protein BTG1-like [Saccostrea cucullata]|uniref:protein BTG1-like n=1 Tax=Saccostrea cuccullata TaxID=36930 RepID=UPI002ED1DE01